MMAQLVEGGEPKFQGHKQTIATPFMSCISLPEKLETPKNRMKSL